ncbi:holin [Bacillus stratosphericus]|uniref:hemolysin XhlA family protein n=1 Tax=Bacillus altitudinis TaxID=293387 RepID=UPI002B2A097B|nr:holin [Bacillus stratosphericus]
MSEPISRDIAELREWLVRIDTKVDYLHDVKHTAEEADAKANKALALGEENRKDIRDMKANTKWV